jgi:signal transduction histidine kinase
MQDTDTVPFNKSLFRKLCFVELFLVFVIIGTEIYYCQTFLGHIFDEAHPVWVSWPILLGMSVMTFFPPVNGSQTRRTIFVLSELVLTLISASWGGQRLYPLLFMVIVSKAPLLLRLKPLLLVIGLVAVSHFSMAQWRLFHQAQTPAQSAHSQWSMMVLQTEAHVLFVLALIFVALISRALAEEHKSRSKAERLTAEVQSLAVALERTRIARDIHDSLGHTLTSLNIQLDVARKLQTRDPQKADEALHAAKELAKQSLSDVRSVVQSIRESEFDFKSAVSKLIETSRATTAIAINLDYEVNEVPEPLAHHLYCILKESLTNIQKHAKATQVAIKLHKASSDIQLEINDNGKGFDKGDRASGFGLKGMRERAESVGGTFTVETAPSQGTMIKVCVPVRA